MALSVSTCTQRTGPMAHHGRLSNLLQRVMVVVAAGIPTMVYKGYASQMHTACKVSSKEQRLQCVCPDGYVFVDEQHTCRGCRPNFVPPSCDAKHNSGGSSFSMVHVGAVAWSNKSAYKMYPLILQQCQTSCLNNCFCAAVLIDGGSCIEVRLFEGGNRGVGTKMSALVKAGASGRVPVLASHTSVLSLIIIGILAISFVSSITYTLWQWYTYNSMQAKRRSSSGLEVLTYKELYQATKGFKELVKFAKGK